MILGIGSDLVKTIRLADMLDQHGQRFIRRCFTKTEQDRAKNYKEGSDIWAAHFAKRWAAKEACAKALGIGIAKSVYLKDIGIENSKEGAPQIILTGGAKKWLTDMTPSGMVAQVNLSLSDEPPHALAFVVISAVMCRDMDKKKEE
jgi:holo-[acyl-carrier protein] synthase